MATYHPSRYTQAQISEKIILDKVKNLIREAIKERSKVTEEKGWKKFPFIRLIWMVLCSIGFIVHSYITTVDYLDYRTTTEVKVYMPIKFRPPAVSICITYNYLLNTSKLSAQQQKSWTQHHCQGVGFNAPCMRIYNEYSIEKIINNLTHDIVWQNSPYIHTIYSKRVQKCVKYAVSELEFIDTGDVDKMTVMENFVLEIRLPELPVKRFHLGLLTHDHRKLPHVREGNVIWVSVDENNYHIGAFDQVESITLESPYATQCSNYANSGFESQSECIEHCYDEQYRIKYGLNCGVITTANFSLAKVPTSYSMRYDKVIDQKCYKKCPNKCESVTYYSVKHGDYELDAYRSRFIHATELSRPFVRVALVAAFDMNSFIIFIASSAGLWLGCSLYASVYDLALIVSKTKL